MDCFDAIVIGLGGMGSATAYQLARRGCRTLAIDQFAAGHDRGSSHGDTRIIRQAYFEHPDYLPLLHESYEQWQQLENATGRQLRVSTGLILIGTPDGEVLTGLHRAKAAHDVDLEFLDQTAFSQRFANFRIEENEQAAYEREAGYLKVEQCVRAHVEEARRAGATILENESVVDWSSAGSDVTVSTPHDRFTAKSLVICAGAWASQIAKLDSVSLRPRRKVVMWFSGPGYQVTDKAPIFGFETADGFFYGFPQIDEKGVKAGLHTGGDEGFDPKHVDRTLNDRDRKPVEQFIADRLPLLTPHAVAHSVCMYTMTNDLHFVVDRHPSFDNVFLAAGFSGHGFKFAPAVGSALADLVIEGQTDIPIGFLRADRLSIRMR